MSIFHLKPNLSYIARYPAFVRLVIFSLVLLSFWLPIAAPVYWLLGVGNATSIVTMSALYVEFVLMLWWWGRNIHQQLHPLQRHGLSRTRQNWLELWKGLIIGFICLWGLFIGEGWIGWLSWQATSVSLAAVALEGLVVAIGIGIVEELLFRGWLVDELRWNYTSKTAIWISGVTYAALHFIKPWLEILRTLPSFPGLLLLGLTLGWARQVHHDRLGFSIGLHAGFVWGYYIVDVCDIIRYTGQVPGWITGIDQNPLAGGLGVLYLCLIALGLRRIKTAQ